MRKISFLGLSVMALTLASAVPASAYSMNGDEMTGKYGAFIETAEPDVVCVYNQTTMRLARMKINPPRLWGTYDEPTWVGWRFQVRNPIPFEDGTLVGSSGTWRDEASLTTGSAFIQRVWRPSEPLNAGKTYFVRYKFMWYAPGSKTEVEGKIVATPSGTGYRMKMGHQHVDSWQGCLGSYPG